MEKEFVPNEESSELKELGFNEPCLKFYATGKLILALDAENGDTNSKLNGYNPLYVSAPTFSQAFKWFREKYEVVGIVNFGTIDFTFNVYNSDGIGLLTKESLTFNGTYEEAELACLRKLIEIVKRR